MKRFLYRGITTISCAAVLLFCASGCSEQDFTKVTLSQGIYSGVEDGKVLSFKGLPNAKPPVGELAEKDVMVVAINYRPGSFGFFAPPELSKENADEGRLFNYGLMDYWVNFARNGNPNHAALPDWPEYSEGKIMLFNPDTTAAQQDPWIQRLDKLNGFLFAAKDN